MTAIFSKQPQRTRYALCVAALASSLIVVGASASGAGATTVPDPTMPTSTSESPLSGVDLVVGTSGDFPPMSFLDEESGDIAGFEADMVAALSDELGFSYTWEQMDFGGLIPALESGRIDLIVSGMYDTEERAGVVDFVDYMQIPLAVIVKSGEAEDVSGPEDLCGKSVAYLTASPPELDQIDAWSQQCIDGGDEEIEAVGYVSVAQAAIDVVNGRVFAELEGDIVVTYIGTTQFGGVLQPAFDVEGGNNLVGMAFAQGSDLTSVFEVALEDYVESDAYCESALQWSLTASNPLRECV